jgi:hypothetical protein
VESASLRLSRAWRVTARNRGWGPVLRGLPQLRDARNRGWRPEYKHFHAVCHGLIPCTTICGTMQAAFEPLYWGVSCRVSRDN